MRSILLSFLTPLLLLPSCFSPQMRGQSIPAAKGETDPYAGEAVVIERSDTAYVMNADGTGVYERTIVAKLTSDAAVRDLGVLTLPYASAVSHVEFKYARARHADGSVTETPVTDVMDQPAQVTVQAPFYSDLKQAQLPVKGLKVGDTLEWQARIVITKAESPGQFWSQETFITDGVVRKETMTLNVPVGTVVNVWTNPRAEAKLVEGTEGDRHVYRWEHSALKSTADRNAETEKNKRKLLTADEELDAEKGKLPSVAWSTFKTWAAVGAWYRGLEGDRETPSAEVKAKVAELIKDKTTEEEKVRAVYSYASAQVRYVGVAFGVGRYQPHRAEVVLENQYGDCKDKHTLLASMLMALGLHPDAVLIGAGVRFNEAVPSPSAFNHMITRVQVDGKEVWLDATAEVAPYKMLMKMIRDQQALVVPDTGTATIERTPKLAPFPQSQTWVAKGSIDEKGVSDSHIVMTLRGDTELLFRQVLRQVSPAQYDAVMKKLLENLGYSGTPTNTLITRPELTEEPLSFTFDYHREQGEDWTNHRIVPQVTPVLMPALDENNPPVMAINLGEPGAEISSAEMKIPAGWGAELPEAVHEKTPYLLYDETYRFAKGTLYTERKVEVLQEKIPVSDWKVYKKFRDAVNPGPENYVYLTKTGGDNSGKKFTAPGGNTVEVASDESAEKLIQEAAVALKEFDTAKAKSLLDQAQTKDSKQRRLWMAYATLATALGEPNEAKADLQKEIALHPDLIEAYPMLASIQFRDKEAEMKTLRQWIAADSLDIRPVNVLLSMQYEDKKYSEGLQVAGTAMKQLPEEQKKDEMFRLNVAQLELKGGQAKKGEDELVAILKETESPLTLNNAAYALSEEGLDLPLDEQSSRTALEKLSKETQTWTLDENPGVLKQQSSLLVSSWDTLGWILFREGKLTEAMDYCHASWLNDLREEVGGHVVAIRAALAKPGEAAALEKADPPTGAKGNPEPKRSTQDMRTLPLGPAGSKIGTAEYRLLIANSKVERVISTDGKAQAGGLEMLQGRSLPGYSPENADGKIVRDAMLNCFSGKCQMVFLPLQ